MKVGHFAASGNWIRLLAAGRVHSEVKKIIGASGPSCFQWQKGPPSIHRSFRYHEGKITRVGKYIIQLTTWIYACFSHLFMSLIFYAKVQCRPGMGTLPCPYIAP